MKKAEWRAIINADYTTVADHHWDLFLALLGRGYFPRQLPPPFTSRSFASAVDSASREIRDSVVNHRFAEQGQLCTYSLARPGQLRRLLGIPNPAHHFLVSLKLAALFKSFHRDYDAAADGYSLSFPTFQANDQSRAFEFATDWNDLPAMRLEARAHGKVLVKADIARFFPSIYTHSIPWVLHGKEQSKKGKFNYSMDGNMLDLLVRNAQDGQTLGIPIGPDTSFIISEKLLLEIDARVYERLHSNSVNAKCFHRVDDYEFVCLTRRDADICLAVLQEVLQIYELELNTLKTEVLDLPQPVQDSEVAQLRSFELGDRPIRNRLLEYFDLAFNSYRQHPKGTLKYAIKRIPSDDYFDETIMHFMCQCMLLEPGAVEAAFVWLTKAECIDQIDKDMFVSCLTSIIKEHSTIGHSSEVAWAIWGFLLLQERIPNDAAEAIVRMGDSVVLLLALDAMEKGLLVHASLPKQVVEVVKGSQLYGPQWLLAYEAAKHGWIPPAQARAVVNDSIFALLLRGGVEFYEAQDIETYKTMMKSWEPYNPYVASVDDFDELPF
jgi:hypothetical protein